jgi:putative phage-type endonuclease
MIQGSQEWIDSRIGKVTASRVGACFTKPRNGYSVSKVREAYLADLLAERLTGKPSVPSYAYGDNGEAVSWGAQTEPFARAAYTERTGNKIELVGFIDHPTVPMSGASPDGLCAGGGVEFKCPNTKTHLETINKGKVPSQYLPQVKWNMACARRLWWDFASFDPRTEIQQLFIVRVQATPDELRAMEMGVFAFVMELEARLAEYQAREGE